MEETMVRELRSDSRFASAFATFVCAWALGLVVLGLTASGGSPGTPDRPTVATAAAVR
jgi:hypothetical protein